MDDELAQAIGLGHWVNLNSPEHDPNSIRKELRHLHAKDAKLGKTAGLPTAIERNLRRIADLVDLTSVEVRILAFAVLIHTDKNLDRAGDMFEELSITRIVQIIASVLNFSEREVRSALTGNGVLAKSGLLIIDKHRHRSLQSSLHLLSDEFADLCTTPDLDLPQLLRSRVRPGAAPTLSRMQPREINCRWPPRTTSRCRIQVRTSGCSFTALSTDASFFSRGHSSSPKQIDLASGMDSAPLSDIM